MKSRFLEPEDLEALLLVDKKDRLCRFRGSSGTGSMCSANLSILGEWFSNLSILLGKRLKKIES